MDQASPVLQKLSRETKVFNDQITLARRGLEALGRGTGLAAISSQFGTINARLLTATASANAFAVAMQRASAASVAVRPPGAVPLVPRGGIPAPSGRSYGGGRSRDGLHVSGISQNIPTAFGHASAHMRGDASGVLIGEAVGIWALTKTMKAAKEYQHQMAQMETLFGNSPNAPQMLGAARDKAWEITRNVRGTEVGENLKTIGEMYSIVGASNALALAPKLAMMDQVLANAGKGKEHGSAYVMTRANELLGTLLNPTTHQVDLPAFEKMMDLMTRVVIGTHGKVTPAEWLAFAKQAGPAAGNLTDEGFYTAAAVIQATSGQRAGTAMQAMNREFVGGVMPQRTAEELVKLGIAQAGDFEVKKGGHIVAKTDAMADLVAKLQRDPLSAFVNNIIPALERAGVTTKEQFQREIYKIFTTSTNQRLAWEIYRGREQMGQERGRMMSSLSTGAAYDVIMNKDPAAVTKGFTAAFHNLLAAFGDPLLSAAVPNMIMLTGAMNAMQGVVRAHPQISGTLGGGLGLSALGAGAGWLLGRPFRMQGAGARWGASAGGALGAYLGWSGYENSVKSDSMALAGAHAFMGAGDLGSAVGASSTARQYMKAGFTFGSLTADLERRRRFEKNATPMKALEWGGWGIEKGTELAFDALFGGRGANSGLARAMGGAVPFLATVGMWGNLAGNLGMGGLALYDEAHSHGPMWSGDIMRGQRGGRSVRELLRDEFHEERERLGIDKIEIEPGKVTINLDGNAIGEAVMNFFVRRGSGPAEGAPYHDSTYSTSPTDLTGIQ